MAVLGVCKSVHLVAHVFGVSETTQVPSGPLNHGKLPASVSKGVRSGPFEDFRGRDDRSEPWLTREEVVQRVLKHPHMD